MSAEPADRGAGPPGTSPGDVARTRLANERTYLAWWRTALAAFAVALAIGRLTPDLLNHPTRWPYVVVGAGYGALGVAIAVYGLTRHRAVNRAVSHRRVPARAPGGHRRAQRLRRRARRPDLRHRRRPAVGE